MKRKLFPIAIFLLVFASFGAFFVAAGSPRAYGQSIPAPPAPISITPDILPPGIVGVPYSVGLTAVATSTGPFYWNVYSGGLPPGLALGASSHSGEASISGTPTEAGSYAFTISATDRKIAAMQDYAITVDGAGTAGVVLGASTTTAPAASSSLFEEMQSEIQTITAEIAQIRAELTAFIGTGIGSGVAAQY